MSLGWLCYRWKWKLAGLLLGINLVVVAQLYSNDASVVNSDDAYDNMALFTMALERIREQYVDEEKISYKDLIYGALKGMLESLDDHSSFLDPEEYANMQEDTSGEFGGLGVTIGIRDGDLTIIAPMKDSPALEAGLLPGDKIIQIDGHSTVGFSLTDAVSFLRGKPKTKVTIHVLRRDTREIKAVDITRAKIEVSSIQDVSMLANDIGYIRVEQFSEPTAARLRKAVDSLMKQGMEAFVLDLRNNPGGLLSSAIDVSQLFLERRSVIVSTVSRGDELTQIARAGGWHHYVDFPMVVLVDEGSASASEIVCGALQDHKRAIVIGDRTFGKGSVQSVWPMRDVSALRFTTAKYYTPSKRAISGQGLQPDIYVPISPERWKALMVELSTPDNAVVADDLRSEEVFDEQLQRAINVLNGIMAFKAKENLIQKFATK